MPLPRRINYKSKVNRSALANFEQNDVTSWPAVRIKGIAMATTSFGAEVSTSCTPNQLKVVWQACARAPSPTKLVGAQK